MLSTITNTFYDLNSYKQSCWVVTDLLWFLLERLACCCYKRYFVIYCYFLSFEWILELSWVLSFCVSIFLLGYFVSHQLGYKSNLFSFAYNDWGFFFTKKKNWSGFLFTAMTKSCKPSKFSFVWTLHSAQLSNGDDSLHRQKFLPHLFPWKRATYWRSFTPNTATNPSNSSLSTIRYV